MLTASPGGRRLATAFAALLLAVGGLAGGVAVAGSAQAAIPLAGGTNCSGGAESIGSLGQVDAGCDVGGAGDTEGSSNPGGDRGPGAGPVEERVCSYQGDEIPCTLSDGSPWDGSRHCYLQVVDPPPPLDDPRWEGRTDGVIISCSNILQCIVDGDAIRIGCPHTSFYWAPRSPTQQGPTPAELAERVVASMQVRAGQIGLAPPSYTQRPGSQFIVGIPAWLWVDDPGAATTGPLEASATDSGVTVTARAELDRIVYSMGDGGSVTCGAGTRWTLAWGEADSPDCGYTYTWPGEYMVTAHSYWTVQWSGSGQSGTIPLDLSTSVPVRVGEIQVLVNS